MVALNIGFMSMSACYELLDRLLSSCLNCSACPGQLPFVATVPSCAVVHELHFLDTVPMQNGITLPARQEVPAGMQRLGSSSGKELPQAWQDVLAFAYGHHEGGPSSPCAPHSLAPSTDSILLQSQLALINNSLTLTLYTDWGHVFIITGLIVLGWTAGQIISD